MVNIRDANIYHKIIKTEVFKWDSSIAPFLPAATDFARYPIHGAVLYVAQAIRSTVYNGLV